MVLPTSRFPGRVVCGLLAILVATVAGPPDARGQVVDPTPRVEEATEAALDWLLRHQEPDGSWSPDGFEARCGSSPCHGPVVLRRETTGPGHGEAFHRVGVTSLALLALLERGWTHESSGRPGRTVTRGLSWLLDRAGLIGSFGFAPASRPKPRGGGCVRHIVWSNHEASRFYDQVLATLVLARSLRATGDPELRQPLRRAVWFLLRLQDPDGGGWGYQPAGESSNTSVTALAVRALTVARQAGLKVPASTFRAAHRWLVRVTAAQEEPWLVGDAPVEHDANGDPIDPASRYSRRGEVGYANPGDGGSFIPPHDEMFTALPSMTALAMVARDDIGAYPPTPVQQAGEQVLLDHLPRWSSEGPSTVNFYYWWAGSMAAARQEGELLEAWRPTVTGILLEHQRSATCAAGSWDPVGDWCVVGGRVYATALGALALESMAER